MIEHKPKQKTIIEDGKKKVIFLCSCGRDFPSKKSIARHLSWSNRISQANIRRKKAAQIQDIEDKSKGIVVKKKNAVGDIVDQVEKTPLGIKFADDKKQGDKGQLKDDKKQNDKEQLKNGKTLKTETKKLLVKSKGFGWLGICVLLGIITLIVVFTIKKTKKSKKNLPAGDKNDKGERKDNGGSAKEPGREWAG